MRAPVVSLPDKVDGRPVATPGCFANSLPPAWPLSGVSAAGYTCLGAYDNASDHAGGEVVWEHFRDSPDEDGCVCATVITPAYIHGPGPGLSLRRKPMGPSR